MDLKAESTLKESFSRDPRGFLSLYEDSFSDLYRFVSRRVTEEKVREQICELAYMDALGQMGTCPKDFSFVTWVYKLAHSRVSEYRKGSVVGPVSDIESPVLDGISLENGVYDDERVLVDQANTFFSALTQMESEIIRMKFFEELTDGEVMFVLDLPDGEVGKMIYQVLKRGYELLFGEVDVRSGVYYGELHSFLFRLKNIEKIPVSETFRLKLKTDLITKIDKRYRDSFDKGVGAPSGSGFAGAGAGSSDPAKVFVNAAKGMSNEEVSQVTEEYVRERESSKVAKSSAEDSAGERDVPIEEMAGQDMPSFVEEEVPVQHMEEEVVTNEVLEKYGRVDRLLDIWERWKYVMSLIPTTLFIAAVLVVASIIVLGKVDDEGVTGLAFEIDYKEGFAQTVSDDFESDPDYGDKVYIENEFVSEIADGKAVSFTEIGRGDGLMEMIFEVDRAFDMEYVFEEFGEGYKVKEFRKF